MDRLCRPYDTYGKYSCQNGPVVAFNADRWNFSLSGGQQIRFDLLAGVAGLDDVLAEHIGTRHAFKQQQDGAVAHCPPHSPPASGRVTHRKPTWLIPVSTICGRRAAGLAGLHASL